MKKFLLSIIICALPIVVFGQPSIFNRDLSIGMRDSASVRDVTTLQNILIQGKYLKGSATGYFGKGTKAALITWQKESGLPSTGYFGKKSRELITRSLPSSALPSSVGINQSPVVAVLPIVASSPSVPEPVVSEVAPSIVLKALVSDIVYGLNDRIVAITVSNKNTTVMSVKRLNVTLSGLMMVSGKTTVAGSLQDMTKGLLSNASCAVGSDGICSLAFEFSSSAIAGGKDGVFELTISGMNFNTRRERNSMNISAVVMDDRGRTNSEGNNMTIVTYASGDALLKGYGYRLLIGKDISLIGEKAGRFRFIDDRIAEFKIIANSRNHAPFDISFVITLSGGALAPNSILTSISAINKNTNQVLAKSLQCYSIDAICVLNLSGSYDNRSLIINPGDAQTIVLTVDSSRFKNVSGVSDPLKMQVDVAGRAKDFYSGSTYVSVAQNEPENAPDSFTFTPLEVLYE